MSLQYDLDLAKALFLSALSSILLARDVFPSSCFQRLPREAINTSYDDLLQGGPAVPNQSPSISYDRDSFLFLKRHDHRHFKYFLSLIERDILPMVESTSIVQLQLCFFNSRAGDEESLVEFFKLKFAFRSDFHVSIHFTWAGLGRKEVDIDASGDALLDLNRFLGSLPQVKGPIYNSLFFYPKVGVPENLTPSWNFGLDIEAAEHILAQKPSYSTCRITPICVNPKHIPERSPVAKEATLPLVEQLSRTRSGRPIRQIQPQKPPNTSTATAVASKPQEVQEAQNTVLGKRRRTSKSPIPVFEKPSEMLPDTQPLSLHTGSIAPNNHRGQAGDPLEVPPSDGNLPSPVASQQPRQPQDPVSAEAQDLTGPNGDDVSAQANGSQEELLEDYFSDLDFLPGDGTDGGGDGPEVPPAAESGGTPADERTPDSKRRRVKDDQASVAPSEKSWTFGQYLAAAAAEESEGVAE